MFDLPSALQAVEDFLAGIDGVERAQTGIPTGLEQRLEAAVIVGAIQTQNKAGSLLLQRSIQFNCAFGYAVAGEETNAEIVLAGAIDDLTAQFYTTRGRPGVPGTGLFNEAATGVVSGTLDLEVSAGDNYPMLLGEEVRQYPFILNLTQQQSLGDL